MNGSGQGTLTAPVDLDVELLLPVNDVPNPELSIVIPALNERLTIAEFIDWCCEGLARAGIVGEILIIDSSDDETAEIALAKGARVLRTPCRGLGRAYIDALAYIRGKYIIMGDADCTYDFRELATFVDGFRAGYEFVMGTRFKGHIEEGSMPVLHRYIGTPATTKVLNILYSSHFSDIHCGMRGITKDALTSMNLQSQSWEYASEMVLKSVHMELTTTEVPVRFLKDRHGRLSHHKRSGWLSPWKAAWINLRSMFIYGADFFSFRPGLVLLALGLALTLPLSLGPITIGPITFSLYWQFLGVTIALLGLQSVFLGSLARVFYDYSSNRIDRLAQLFRYSRSVVISAALVISGGLFGVPLIVRYIGNSLSLPDSLDITSHLAVTGLLFVIIGFMLFCFMLLVKAVALYVHSNRGNG